MRRRIRLGRSVLVIIVFLMGISYAGWANLEITSNQTLRPPLATQSYLRYDDGYTVCSDIYIDPQSFNSSVRIATSSIITEDTFWYWGRDKEASSIDNWEESLKEANRTSMWGYAESNDRINITVTIRNRGEVDGRAVCISKLTLDATPQKILWWVWEGGEPLNYYTPPKWLEDPLTKNTKITMQSSICLCPVGDVECKKDNPDFVDEVNYTFAGLQIGGDSAEGGFTGIYRFEIGGSSEIKTNTGYNWQDRATITENYVFGIHKGWNDEQVRSDIDWFQELPTILGREIAAHEKERTIINAAYPACVMANEECGNAVESLEYMKRNLTAGNATAVTAWESYKLWTTKDANGKEIGGYKQAAPFNTKAGTYFDRAICQGWSVNYSIKKCVQGLTPASDSLYAANQSQVSAESAVAEAKQKLASAQETGCISVEGEQEKIELAGNILSEGKSEQDAAVIACGHDYNGTRRLAANATEKYADAQKLATEASQSLGSKLSAAEGLESVEQARKIIEEIDTQAETAGLPEDVKVKRNEAQEMLQQAEKLCGEANFKDAAELGQNALQKALDAKSGLNRTGEAAVQKQQESQEPAKALADEGGKIETPAHAISVILILLVLAPIIGIYIWKWRK